MPTLFIVQEYFISLSSIACFSASVGDKGMSSSIDKGMLSSANTFQRLSHAYS